MAPHILQQRSKALKIQETRYGLQRHRIEVFTVTYCYLWLKGSKLTLPKIATFINCIVSIGAYRDSGAY